MLSIERVVVFIYAPLIAAACTVLAKYGINLDPAGVDTVAGLGVTAIGAAILKWLHGRQNVRLLSAFAEAKHYAEQAKVAVEKVDPGIVAQVERLGKTDIDRLASLLHVPAPFAPGDDTIKVAPAQSGAVWINPAQTGWGVAADTNGPPAATPEPAAPNAPPADSVPAAVAAAATLPPRPTPDPAPWVTPTPAAASLPTPAGEAVL